jgi:hypothetical protein
MYTNQPLDSNLGNENVLTAKQIIQRLEKNGFHESYENSNGDIEVKGQSSLECAIKKEADQTWSVDVSVEYTSVYTIIPSAVLLLFCNAAGLQGTLFMVGSALAGLGIGTLILTSKKESLKARLEDAIAG